MGQMKKITVEVMDRELSAAVDATGKSISETVREALRELAHRDACQKLLALRGKVHLDIDLDELRKDKDEE